MPIVQDWGVESFMEDPHCVLNQMFDKYYAEDSNTWDTKILEKCRSLFQSEDILEKIPLLNNIKKSEFKNAQIVRFRCMVQDMFEPELQLSLYQVKNLKTGEIKEKSALFYDTIESCEIQTFEDRMMNGKHSKLIERRLFYCISVPGENVWVKESWRNAKVKVYAGDPSAEVCESQTKESIKRQLDAAGSMDSPNKHPTSSKSSDELHTNQSNSGRDLSLLWERVSNFPFPSMLEHGKGCIVKVYDAETKLAINDVQEFVGILSLDPLLVLDEENRSQKLDLGIMDLEEMQAHHPPMPLIPRLHMISHRSLPHVNPSIPLTPLPLGADTADTCFQLKKLLTDALLGDEFCAEYVMLNLISHVYSRVGALPLGKLALNLVAPSLHFQDFSAIVYEVIQSLVPKSFHLDLNLDILNTSAFTPKKDYISNRLKSGVLQLSEGTSLLITDKVEPGQLNGMGISNMGALSILIASQKVDYDFQFHKLEFHADIPIIILSSEVNSVLKECDVVLPIRTDYDAGSYIAAKNRINSLLEDHTFLTRMRNFLTIARAQKLYSLEEPIQMMIQEEFVLSRETLKESGLTDGDLHTLLTISRYLSLLQGKQSLDEETWLKACAMERERKNRLAENRHN